MSFVERFEHEGVEGLRVGRFRSKINTTCVVYRVGETLIDAGPPNQWAVLRRWLVERPVRRLLITHHHEDHAGNAKAIAEKLRIPLFMHPRGIELSAVGFPVQVYRRIVWGRPPRFRARALLEDVESAGGFHLRAVHTPGHSVDMTCFLETRRGWLFTGDLFITGSPRYLRKDEDPHEEIRSLQRALELDFSTIFCAHRGVLGDGRAALERKLEHLIELRDRARALHEEGKPVEEIVRQLLGREGFLSMLSAGHFSKRNFIEALCRE